MPLTIVAPFTEDITNRYDPSWQPVVSRKNKRRQTQKNRVSMASTAIPAIMQRAGCQIPVWEITSASGQISYVERHDVDGYRPIGLIDTFSMDERIPIEVCCLARSDGYIHPSCFPGMDRDGTISIPMSYYEPIRS